MIIQILKEIISDTKFRLFHPYSIKLQGFKMLIDTKASYVMRKTFRAYDKYRVHEPATTKLFRVLLRDGDIVIDIGANIGYFSLLSASIGAKVYAFEPERKNINYLRENITLNNFDNIRVFDLAVSDRTGKSTLFLCPYDSGHHTINQNKGIKNYRKTSLMRKCLDIVAKKNEPVEITTVALDDFVRRNKLKVDLIKMDCEGAEELALRGMDKTLRDNKNIKMIVEFFPLLLRSMGSSPKKFINKLIMSYKFKVMIIPDDYNAENEMVEVKTYNELMSYCPNKEDHLNLYLTRT